MLYEPVCRVHRRCDLTVRDSDQNELYERHGTSYEIFQITIMYAALML